MGSVYDDITFQRKKKYQPMEVLEMLINCAAPQVSRRALVWFYGCVALTVLAGLLFSSRVTAEDLRGLPEGKCAGAPKRNGKAHQRFDGVAFMSVASLLEAQGESNFRLQYDNPEAECLVETFEVGSFKVSGVFNPWKKGLQTLYYRFVADGQPARREILVLYNGSCGMLNGGYCFHVSEQRDGIVSWYAMFRDEPPYAPMKEIVGSILNGTAKPLLAVRWPEGAKQGEVVAYDSDRLK
jgi:hypothetical protein